MRNWSDEGTLKVILPVTTALYSPPTETGICGGRLPPVPHSSYWVPGTGFRHQGLKSWPPSGDLLCADCQFVTLLYFILLIFPDFSVIFYTSQDSHGVVYIL